MLFDMGSCRYSERFPLYNLLVSQTQSHWYYFEYEEGSETLYLKYVTGELEDQLGWYSTPDEEFESFEFNDAAALG